MDYQKILAAHDPATGIISESRLIITEIAIWTPKTKELITIVAEDDVEGAEYVLQDHVRKALELGPRKRRFRSHRVDHPGGGNACLRARPDGVGGRRGSERSNLRKGTILPQPIAASFRGWV
jgi:hypothetical protein